MIGVLIGITMIFCAHAVFALAMLSRRTPRCSWCERPVQSLMDTDLCDIGEGCMQ